MRIISLDIPKVGGNHGGDVANSKSVQKWRFGAGAPNMPSDVGSWKEVEAPVRQVPKNMLLRFRDLVFLEVATLPLIRSCHIYISCLREYCLEFYTFT